MSQTHSVKNLLGDEALIGSHVTVKGWLRSKRDSKAGISFLAVNDGSHFDSLQCVAPKELENYEDEVLKLDRLRRHCLRRISCLAGRRPVR